MKSRKNFKIKNNINNYYKKNKVINKNIGPKLSSYKQKKSDYQKENIKKIQKNSNFKSNKIEDLLLNDKNQKVKKLIIQIKIEIQEGPKEIRSLLNDLKKKIKQLEEDFKILNLYLNNLFGISYEG